MLSGAIEQAQKTVESRNFQARKSVLEYDDVMNQQRGIIYGERRKVLDGEDLREQITGMIREFVVLHHRRRDARRARRRRASSSTTCSRRSRSCSSRTGR